jgi:hypothetical protein
MPKPKTNTESDADFLKFTRDLAAIIAIYLYFAGWLYIYYYYNRFGLSIKQLDIDFYSFIVYSLNVILYLLHYWYFTALAITVSIVLIKIIKRNWVIYSICILLFVAMYYSSVNAAIVNAGNDFTYHYSHLKKIRFVLKKEEFGEQSVSVYKAKNKETDGTDKKDPGKLKNNKTDTTGKMDAATDSIMNEFVSRNKSNNLKLLASTKDDYFVVFANKKVTKETVDDYPIEVYTIKRENVILIKLDN